MSVRLKCRDADIVTCATSIHLLDVVMIGGRRGTISVLNLDFSNSIDFLSSSTFSLIDNLSSPQLVTQDVREATPRYPFAGSTNATTIPIQKTSPHRLMPFFFMDISPKVGLQTRNPIIPSRNPIFLQTLKITTMSTSPTPLPRNQKQGSLRHGRLPQIRSIQKRIHRPTRRCRQNPNTII